MGECTLGGAVKIVSGPRKTSSSTTARFKFEAEPATGAKFECKLDGKKWAGCKSPKAYKKLKPPSTPFACARRPAVSRVP